MRIKLFVVGRSGCGKSRAARHVTEFVKPSGWTIRRFKDYDILEEKAQNDARFRLLKDGGFDVLNVSALDEALRTLDNEVNVHYIEHNQSSKNELIVIEFAREDYNDAFRKLSRSVQKDAYFLLIDADFETCIQRIHDRTISPTSSDDHNVSDFAMNTYYRNQLPPTDAMILERYWEVENKSTWDDFTKELEPFIRKILNIPDSHS